MTESPNFSFKKLKEIVVNTMPKLLRTGSKKNVTNAEEKNQSTAYKLHNTRNKRAKSSEASSMCSNLSGSQKYRAAKFFGSPKLSSRKADSILGPDSDTYKPFHKSTQNLLENWAANKERQIHELVTTPIHRDEYKIPETAGTISDKFLKVCGDETMELMAKRHLPNNIAVPQKAIKMMGTTALLPSGAKKILGSDEDEQRVEGIIDRAVEKLNKPIK